MKNNWRQYQSFKMFRIGIFAILSLCCIWRVTATCNICSPITNFRCTAYNRYQFCDATGPVGAVYTCPANSYCSTVGGSICSSTTSLTIPECKCGVCGLLPTASISTTACITDTQFAICFAGGDIIPDTGSNNCPTGMECVEGRDAANPCGIPTVPRGNSCPVGSAPAPAPVCSATGRFPVAGTMCKNYNLCTTLVNGTLTYYTYTCPGTSTFSPVSQTCSTTYVCPV
ncbi:uncharacterized protein LOC143910175 [Arctopsyche grandis]|uniref:uncharacterized protein LOC143910175 n=1 Tax=Arctopsyche grandis TaxID=121162 RepID=UPI00406D7F56